MQYKGLINVLCAAFCARAALSEETVETQEEHCVLSTSGSTHGHTFASSIFLGCVFPHKCDWVAVHFSVVFVLCAMLYFLGGGESLSTVCSRGKCKNALEVFLVKFSLSKYLQCDDACTVV